MRENGFTLIEVLISVTLVSLLAAGIMLAMRVGLSAMQKTDAKLMLNRRVVGTQRIFEQEIAGLMPVTADCRPGGDVSPVRVMFFQGEQQSMRFVSSYSLKEAARGVPMILEFQVIPGEDGRGVRLVLNERQYSGPDSTGATCQGQVMDPIAGGPVTRYLPIQIGAGSFVLADKLAFCRFSFRNPATIPPGDSKWVEHWINPTMLPDVIRIDMAPLDPDPSRLQPVSLTMPVHVDRLPLVPYGNP